MTKLKVIGNTVSALIGAITSLSTTDAIADVYKFVHPDGTVTYSNAPIAGSVKLETPELSHDDNTTESVPLQPDPKKWALVAVTTESRAYKDKRAQTGILSPGWFIIDYREPRMLIFPDAKYLSTKNLIQYDCKSRTEKMLQVAYYSAHSGTGSFITQQVTPSNLAATDVIPDTVGEVMLRSVCSKRSPG